MRRSDYILSESEIHKELRKFYHTTDPLIIFDIGACECEDSIRYAIHFPHARIYAFEPLADNIALCERHIRQYQKNNIHLFQLAISNYVGKGNLFVSSGAPPQKQQDEDWNYGNKSSSLLAPKKVKITHPWLKFEKTIIVEVDTINHFCKTHHIPYVNYIHMDIQGAELKALEGAEEMFPFIHLIYMEVSDIELYKNQALRKDIEKFMKKHNFSLYKSFMSSHTGDQLYVNNHFFTTIKKLSPPV